MADFSDFLKSVEYFKDLDDEEIGLLNDVCRLETYAADTVVIAEGTSKDNFYIIQDGSVSILNGFINRTAACWLRCVGAMYSGSFLLLMTSRAVPRW